MTNIIQKGTADTVRTTAYSLQYSGTFMEIPMLTVTIKSPALIAFAIGDFIVWDYDGLTYTLKELPPVSKQATANTYGEAFVYEGVKFVSALADIKYLEFLDVVPTSDTTSHFSSLPTFSFYGNVFALIDRLNANLGRLYANWIVEAADVESGDIYDALYTDRDVTIDSPIKVRDALALVYSMWGLGFVYLYDTVTAKHTITIGEYGANTGGFSYGQGNGLYMVGKTITKEDSIVTRLRAYGSTRNMPARYYNTKVILDNRILIQNDPMLYLPNLMIPYTKWGENPYEPDPELAYINCNNADIEILTGVPDTSYVKYGIREQSVYFDGTNNTKEIYPTIEGITSGEMREAVSGYTGAQMGFYIPPSITEYPVGTERLDVISVGDNIALTDDGIIKTDSTYKVLPTFLGDTDDVVMTDRVMTKSFEGIYFATLTSDGEYKVTFADQGVTAVCADSLILDGALRVWIVKDGNRQALAATITGVAITNGFEFALPELVLTTQEANGLFSIEMELEVTLSDWHLGDLATVTWTREAGTATYELVKTVPNNTFTIELKQIGFDIFRFLPSAGQTPIISMTSGSCAARQFNITKTTYLSATDSWQLTCVRQKDNSIGQWFPNSNFKIKAEDSFVLLNINMPDILIDIAELRLYDEGCKWLKKRKEQQYIYEPKIDEVYMAIKAAAGTPEIIKEGMMMPLVDTDLSVPEGTILINSLTVTESEDSVRKFEVVLREDTDTDLLKYLNAQAKQISSSAVGGITNATTATTESATPVTTQTTTATSLGFTPENIANKTSVISVDSTATQYPNAKAVYDGLAIKMTTTSYADLVAIEALTGISGLLKKTAADTWTLDTTTYVSGTPWTSVGYYIGDGSAFATATGGSGYIQNQIASVQTADFWISGIAKMGTLQIPKTAPVGMTANQWHLSVVEAGFAGEEPSGLQPVLDGTGFVKSTAGVISYDNSTYLVSTAKAADSDKLNGQTATYYLAASLVGAANGITPLDSGGKVALQYLPSTLLKYVSVWNASTNSPTLTNPDTTKKGNVYTVSTAGTQFGLAFSLGDWLIYNDSGVPEKSDNSDDVTSVAGKTGAVTLVKADITDATTWDAAYTHSQITGGTGVHISDTERTNWGTAYSHTSLTNNPHSVTAAQAGALSRIPYEVTDFAQLWQSGIYAGLTVTNAPHTGDVVSVRLPYMNAAANYRFGVDIAGWGDLYHRLANEDGIGAWYKIWSEKNSNLSTVDWTAQELSCVRMRVPKTAPTGMTTGEYYFSMADTGWAGEEPSGGGGVTLFSALSDVSLVTPTAGQVPMWGDYTGLKLRNTTLLTSHITESGNLFYTNARVKAYGDTLYDAIGAAVAVTPTTLGLVIGVNVLAYRTFGSAANSATTDFLGATAKAADSDKLDDHDSTYFATADHTHSGVYEPAFSKNTGFNKAFGTTTGTVLEGRTFGTAATAATTDFDVAGAASTVQGNLNTHAGLTATAHGLGASAFHADSFFAAAAGSTSQNFNTAFLTIQCPSNALGLKVIGRSDDYTNIMFANFDGNPNSLIETGNTLFNIYTYTSSEYRNRLSINVATGIATFGSTVIMPENINTRLTIPSSAPSGMTAGRWYISII